MKFKIQENSSAINALNASNDIALHALEHKINHGIASLEIKVAEAFNDVNKKVAAVGLLHNRVYQIENHKETNRTRIHSINGKVEHLGGQMETMRKNNPAILQNSLIHQKTGNTVVGYDNKPITNFPETVRDLDHLDENELNHLIVALGLPDAEGESAKRLSVVMGLGPGPV